MLPSALAISFGGVMEIAGRFNLGGGGKVLFAAGKNKIRISICKKYFCYSSNLIATIGITTHSSI